MFNEDRLIKVLLYVAIVIFCVTPYIVEAQTNCLYGRVSENNPVSPCKPVPVEGGNNYEIQPVYWVTDSQECAFSYQYNGWNQPEEIGLHITRVYYNSGNSRRVDVGVMMAPYLIPNQRKTDIEYSQQGAYITGVTSTYTKEQMEYGDLPNEIGHSEDALGFYLGDLDNVAYWQGYLFQGVHRLQKVTVDIAPSYRSSTVFGQIWRDCHDKLNDISKRTEEDAERSGEIATASTDELIAQRLAKFMQDQLAADTETYIQLSSTRTSMLEFRAKAHALNIKRQEARSKWELETSQAIATFTNEQVEEYTQLETQLTEVGKIINANQEESARKIAELDALITTIEEMLALTQENRENLQDAIISIEEE